MITKTSFKEATKLKNIWNKIISWNGLYIATVQWHENKEWKIIRKNEVFDDIASDGYKPIADFHTQEQLWQYIKDNELNN